MADKKRMGTDPLDWISDTRAERKQKRGRPKTATRVVEKSTQEGLKEGWTRATFIVREDYLEKLKDLAYWERRQIKELMDDILGSYLKGKRIRKRA